MDRVGSFWRLLLISSVIWIHSVLSRSVDVPRYETAYACEGKTLKIECADGERIHLIRANYGRFSITICNDHGNTDWSVNCMSHKSLRVLHTRCEMSPNCSVDVSNYQFQDDPCPGTQKYVEAHYICVASTTTTTNRPSPPWLITSQPPSVWSTPTARPPTGPPLLSETSSDSSSYRTTSSQNVSSVNIPQFNIVTPAPLPPLDFDSVKPETSGNEESTEDVDLSNIPPSSPTTVLFSTFGRNSPGNMTETPLNEYVPSPSIPWFQENDSCSPVTVRNLNWNWTRIGDKVIQPCPGGATGLARWRCVAGAGRDRDPTWFPDTPDLSECRSVWLTSLESRIIEGDSLIAITSDLAMVTSSKTLYGGDMMITTKIIMKMAQKMANDIQSFPDPRQREAIVSELLSGVVRTGSNLLDWSQHPSWRDLGYKEQMQVATSLLIGLEENAFLLADTVIREKTVVQTVRNIMLSVRVLETYNIGTETFPSPGSATDQWSVSNDWVQLPRSALRENSEGGLVRLVFVAFDRLEEILQWNPESYDHGSSHNVSRVLNSKVISASLGKGRHIQLSEPIRLMLRHIKTENVSNPSCVFWDYTMSAWSEEGCRVESTNRTHTMCLCDHLTNFAILMDVHMTYLPPGHQMALQIITYIGCIISIICLILAIITFHLFRGLKSDRTTIHKNLCFCLLVAEILFIVGINQTEHVLLCGIVAGLLHFFFLCAFAWMFLEGFQLYVLLVEVFEAEKSRARWYYLVAYGTPLLVVIGSAVADPHSYGTDKSCWLRADNFFIFTFVGPVILVILANLIFLSMAIFIMCRHANASISMKSKEHSRLASARVWLRGAIVLVFLLGLTWTFGLLYLNEETVIMAYIFTILNSLQGLFIFMFHCVQNEKVRKEYRKLIRRHSWLPRCLPCSKPNGSSGTSGSNSRGGGSGGSGSGSGGLCKERRGSLYAATSNGNAASTDSSALSPHTASQYSLQRNWSSRSCNTIGHIGVGKNNSLTTTTNNYNTSSRLHNFHHDHNDTLPQTQQQIQPCIVPDAQSAAVLNSNIDTATATLPYIRNHKRTTTNINSLSSNSPAEDTDESNLNPVFPKSATTWGPLNKPLQWKNISFKSYSRDSGHGGSEQEESPRSYNTSAVGPCSPVGNLQQRLSNAKDSHRKPFMAADFHQCNNLSEPKQFVDYLHGAAESLAHQQQLAELSQQIQQLPQNTRYNHLHQHSLGGRKKQNGGTFRTGTVNPRNHTYTEIHDACRMAQAHAHAANLGGGFYHGGGEDPVYEEIDRNEMQVSDMSDEDGRRQSDMSRQSSRSYGDHRPLIPSYSPAAERSLIEDRDRMCTVAGGGREQHVAVQGRRHNAYGGEHARSLAAVLDGETVVCHLEPPDLYPSSRTMVLPPYTEC